MSQCPGNAIFTPPRSVFTCLFLSALKHQTEQTFSAFRSEYSLKYTLLGVRCGSILEEIDEEIRLHKDLVIHSIDIIVCVVMSYQIADTVDDLLGQERAVSMVRASPGPSIS